MFRQASAIVVVSRAMRNRLIELGAPEARICLNYYGVDPERFKGSDPAQAGPVFLAVGRFTEKKGPALTIRAFALVAEQLPSSRLRMIGSGTLLDECRQLVTELGLDGKVEFLGPRPHEEIGIALRTARCFVQHSLVAASGDSEGAPVAILEAQSSGLPVVSTRHAGIPDIVVEGESGFLVAEGDVGGMAESMLRLGNDATLAGQMGRFARQHVIENFTDTRSIAGLWNIILEATRRQSAKE
jgi:glycosyltransferase involved in cell wall biosynthesis